MPKKRHQTKYSKPQSTAPPSLESSRRESSHENHGRSVNELLADLRRVKLSPGADADIPQIAAPSVPPAIRQILQLPETPAPVPRRPQRLLPSGRRLPPGPAPPRSWLGQSRHAPASKLIPHSRAAGVKLASLPGLYAPEPGSLIDAVLRQMLLDWEAQKHYNLFYMSSLPSHLRTACISYVSRYGGAGLNLSDLQVLLLPGDRDGGSDLGVQSLDPSLLNEGITHLDLTGSLDRSIKLKELSGLLFPSETDDISRNLQDSWDVPDAGAIPQPLLPNLTHLSLAIHPQHAPSVSWRHLLSFASHLPTLTHLSLAYWPVPTLTPNARNASVVSQQGRTLQYGGTGPYSHSLDDNWSEAVHVLRKLSKSLYGLEYLDLTGCYAWSPALIRRVDDCEVDWVGNWGKVTEVVLSPGDCEGLADGARSSALATTDSENLGMIIARHIRREREGKGRIITIIEKDEASA